MTPPATPAAPTPRVALVVRSDAFHGVERYITYVAPRLRAHDWDAVVIGGDPVRMRESLEGAGVPHLPAATTWQAATALVRCGPVDVVHAHMSAAELASVATRPFIHAPVVATRHFAARRGSSALGRVAAVLINRSVDCDIAISRFVAESIGRPSAVVPNGVPCATAVSRGQRTVTMAQRLEEEKRVDVGLRAWAASGLAAANWRLQVAGSGSREGALRNLTHRLGIERSVAFVGPQPDLHDLLAGTEIFLATAEAEPFGLSVVEAMAAAVPVVASASGAHLETVGACSSVWLFPPGDHQAGAAKLRELAEDADARAHYGDDLQRTQRRLFDLDDHVAKLVAVYRRVLGTRAEKASRRA